MCMPIDFLIRSYISMVDEVCLLAFCTKIRVVCTSALTAAGSAIRRERLRWRREREIAGFVRGDERESKVKGVGGRYGAAYTVVFKGREG